MKWWFKKKSIEDPAPVQTCRTIICIPGKWKNQEEFTSLLTAEANDEYAVQGNILINKKQLALFILEFYERDENMQRSFSVAGKVTRMSNACLDSIGAHTCVIYLSGTTGNYESARQIAFAADSILKAGGLGIKIETTGKAFEKEKWHKMIVEYEESVLYEMFVLDSITDSKGSVYSCGMHNIGHKDTIVSGEPFQEAVDLISLFGYFQIIDKPELGHLHTFSRDTVSIKFRITDEADQPNKGHDLFENPFGMWRLTKES